GGNRNDGFGGGRNDGFGRNNGWNDGWGNGSGWNNRAFDYSGGRRGAGSFRDQSGQRRRLDDVNVTIRESGDLTVTFQGENGRVQFTGRIDSRDNRRVFANVNGGGRRGRMTIEMSDYNRIRSISVDSWNLDWSN